MNIQGIMHQIVDLLTAFIENYGLWAVFIFMTAESALVPIPSEVTMAFAGFLAGRGVMDFWLAVFIGALGNLVGSLLAYWLGYYLREEWIRIAIKKWGKYLLIREKDFDLSLRWFEKYGQGVTFVSRLLPIVRTFISLPAGIAEMDLKIFVPLTFIGSFFWSLFLCYLGFKLGDNWQAIEPIFRQFQFIIIGGLVILGVLYIRHHLKEEKHA
ncbi:DedA family protein [Candidatus Woesebacteria bacterium]|nr:DedA family protein [Candidatus Woesebacteria bacterium]